MIETPPPRSASATIVPHVDFLSVGSDTRAVHARCGRDDPAVSHYTTTPIATVLRLLAIIITDAPGVRSRCAARWQGARRRCRQYSGSLPLLSMARGDPRARKELIAAVRLGERRVTPAAAH